jgi:cell volume regulation protein A
VLPSEFPIRADVALGLLADMYGLEVEDEADRERTIADIFAERYEGTPTLGDRLRLEPATIVVREMVEDRVVRIGLRLEGEPRARRGWIDLLKRTLGLSSGAEPPPA